MLAYVTQTTLSVDDAAEIVAALRRRFPGIVGPKKDDICYATQNRQDAVKFMAPIVDVVIVVGSPNSSNSNRLREVAAIRGTPAYMVDRADQLDPAWIAGKRRVGVTAGASAPEVLVAEVIARLQALGAQPGARARRRAGAGGVSVAQGIERRARRARRHAIRIRQHAVAPRRVDRQRAASPGRGAPRGTTRAPRRTRCRPARSRSTASRRCRPPSVSARTIASAT